MTQINNTIASIAASYVGEREVPGNMGFTNKQFEKKMIDVGFIKSYSWCALFAELVWSEAYKGTQWLAVIKALFSASATTTYKNFDIDKRFEVSQVPQIGAVVIWRHGSGWQGHAGIVTAINGNTIATVEGNTNAAGGREGIEVAEKVRKIKQPFQANGLNLVGFIIPKQL